MPKNPWEKIHIDIYGPLPDGNSIIGVIDETSRWPEIAVVRKATSENVVKCLDTIFACWGNPKVVISDNGTQFTSHAFRSHLEMLGIKHRLVTLYRPRANGEIEQFFRNLSKTIKICILQGKGYKSGIHRFLQSYRSSPRMTTGVSPADLMLGFKPWNKLPMVEQTIQSREFRLATRADKKNKLAMKTRYDVKNHTKVSELKLGDIVIQTQEKQDKFTPRFDGAPYKVVAKCGNAVTIEREGVRYKRNVSRLKKVRNEFHLTGYDGAVDEEIELEGEIHGGDHEICDEFQFKVEQGETQEAEGVESVAGMPNNEREGRPVRLRKRPPCLEPYNTTFTGTTSPLV